LWTSKVPMTAFCPTQFLLFSFFCLPKQAFSTLSQRAFNGVLALESVLVAPLPASCYVD
jgi:hypothetical protein